MEAAATTTALLGEEANIERGRRGIIARGRGIIARAVAPAVLLLLLLAGEATTLPARIVAATTRKAIDAVKKEAQRSKSENGKKVYFFFSIFFSSSHLEHGPGPLQAPPPQNGLLASRSSSRSQLPAVKHQRPGERQEQRGTRRRRRALAPVPPLLRLPLFPLPFLRRPSSSSPHHQVGRGQGCADGVAGRARGEGYPEADAEGEPRRRRRRRRRRRSSSGGGEAAEANDADARGERHLPHCGSPPRRGLEAHSLAREKVDGLEERGGIRRRDRESEVGEGERRRRRRSTGFSRRRRREAQRAQAQGV